MTWKIIGKTDWGEPVLQNEYGCILEGGCGNAPDGHQCGECYGKDGCPVLRESCKEDLEKDWADKRWPRISSFEDLERVYFPNKYTEEIKKIREELKNGNANDN